MHDLMFAGQMNLGTEDLSSLARSLGLNEPEFVRQTIGHPLRIPSGTDRPAGDDREVGHETRRRPSIQLF